MPSPIPSPASSLDDSSPESTTKPSPDTQNGAFMAHSYNAYPSSVFTQQHQLALHPDGIPTPVESVHVTESGGRGVGGRIRGVLGLGSKTAQSQSPFQDSRSSHRDDASYNPYPSDPTNPSDRRSFNPYAAHNTAANDHTSVSNEEKAYINVATPDLELDLDTRGPEWDHPLARLSRSRRGLLMLVFSVASFVDVCNVSGVGVAVAQIGVDIDLKVSQWVWVITAYSLTFASFLLFVGRLADLFPASLIFQGGFFSLGIMSLATSFVTKNKYGFLLLRAVGGICGSMTIPSAYHLLVHMYPDPAEKRAKIALLAISAALGNVLGLIIAGLIMLKSYVWFFRLMAIICFLFSALAVALLPYTGATHRYPQRWKRLDVVGVVLISGALVCFILGLTQGPIDGWGHASFIAPFVISICLAVAFFVWENRLHPRKALLPSTVWKIKNMKIASLVTLMPFSFWATSQLLYSNYWQSNNLKTPLNVSVACLPQGVAVILMGAFVQFFPPLVTRPRITIPVGCVLVMIAEAVIYFSDGGVGHDYWNWTFPAFVVGSVGAVAVFMASGINLINYCPPEMGGVAGAWSQTMAQVGAAIGFAVQAGMEENSLRQSEWRKDARSCWYQFAGFGFVALVYVVFYREYGEVEFEHEHARQRIVALEAKFDAEERHREGKQHMKQIPADAYFTERGFSQDDHDQGYHGQGKELQPSIEQDPEPRYRLRRIVHVQSTDETHRISYAEAESQALAQVEEHNINLVRMVSASRTASLRQSSLDGAMSPHGPESIRSGNAPSARSPLAESYVVPELSSLQEGESTALPGGATDVVQQHRLSSSQRGLHSNRFSSEASQLHPQDQPQDQATFEMPHQFLAPLLIRSSFQWPHHLLDPTPESPEPTEPAPQSGVSHLSPLSPLSGSMLDRSSKEWRLSASSKAKRTSKGSSKEKRQSTATTKTNRDSSRMSRIPVPVRDVPVRDVPSTTIPQSVSVQSHKLVRGFSDVDGSGHVRSTSMATMATSVSAYSDDLDGATSHGHGHNHSHGLGHTRIRSLAPSLATSASVYSHDERTSFGLPRSLPPTSNGGQVGQDIPPVPSLPSLPNLSSVSNVSNLPSLPGSRAQSTHHTRRLSSASGPSGKASVAHPESVHSKRSAEFKDVTRPGGSRWSRQGMTWV